MIKSVIAGILSYFLVFGQTVALAQSTAAILPQGKTQFFSNNGDPLTSGKVYFYVPSTTTSKTTWQDSGKTIPNTNPVILDAGGRAIIYGDGTYRQIVRDRNNNIIYDAITASAGSGGGTTGTGDGDLVGTVKPWAGLIAPNQYAFAYGQELSRTTYSVLFTALTSVQNVNCTSGSPILTGLSDTSQILDNASIGTVIESSCAPAGSIIISKTSTTVTLNANSSLTTTASATFFFYGNGNGSTTFNLPDMRGTTVVGRCNMGGTSCVGLNTPYFTTNPNATGAKSFGDHITLGTNNLPAYTPAGTISTATGTISQITPAGTNSAPTFTSTGGTGGSATTNLGGASPTGTVYITTSAGITGTVSAPTFTGTPVTPTFTGAVQTFTGTAQGGTATPFSTVQPSITLNYIIKITPDSNSADASGVTSLGGMTGDIACGTGLLCTGNIVSTNLTLSQGAVSGNPSGSLFAAPYTITIPSTSLGTSDDAIVIQTAINAISTQGAGTLILPPGNWITSQLILKDGLTLKCTAPADAVYSFPTGGTTLSLKYSVDASLFYIPNDALVPISNITIDGCRLYGNKSNLSILGTASNAGAVQIQLASTASLTTGDQVAVQSIGGTREAEGVWTITVNDATHITLQTSVFSHAWTSGGTVSKIGNSHGIESQYGTQLNLGVVIRNTNIRNFNNSGIYLRPLLIAGRIENSWIENNNVDAIRIEESDWHIDSTIIGDAGSVGLHIIGGGSHQITNLTAYHFGKNVIFAEQGNQDGHTSLYGGNNNTFTNVVLEYAYQDGVVFGANTFGNTIVAGYIHNSSQALTNTYSDVKLLGPIPAGGTYHSFSDLAFYNDDISSYRSKYIFDLADVSTVVTVSNLRDTSNYGTSYSNFPANIRSGANSLWTGAVKAVPSTASYALDALAAGDGIAARFVGRSADGHSVIQFTNNAETMQNGAIGVDDTGLMNFHATTFSLQDLAGCSNGIKSAAITGILSCATGAATAITVGTTTITSGTSTRVLYDNSGVLGEYTNTQLTALINPATTSLSGALPAWPNNSTTFFRGDGTYAAVTSAALNITTTTCTNQFVSAISATATGTCSSVALAALATQAANTIVGNATAGTATPTALTMTACSGSASAVSWTNGTGFGCNIAITATTGTTVSTSTSASFFPLFVASSSNSNQAFNLGTGLSFNPSTNNLTTTTFTGALAGNATTATTATNVTNTAITDDTTTNAAMNLTWVTSNTGNLPQKVSSTKLNFNPSTGVLSSTSFTGAATGLTGSSSITGTGTLTSGSTGAGFTVALGTSTVTGVLGITNGGTGASSIPNFKVTLTSNQSVTTATVAKVGFDSAVFDVGSYWDNTNKYYKPLVSGTYQFCTSIIGSATFTLAADNFQVLMSKNGTIGSGGTRVNTTTMSVPTGGVDAGLNACMLVPMNGSTDTLEVDAVITGVAPTIAGSANLVSTFTGYRISP